MPYVCMYVYCVHTDARSVNYVRMSLSLYLDACGIIPAVSTCMHGYTCIKDTYAIITHINRMRMHIYIYICEVYLPGYICIKDTYAMMTYITRLRMHIYIHTCTYIYIYIYVYANLHTSKHVHKLTKKKTIAPQ
jgi:hypothetical protein